MKSEFRKIGDQKYTINLKDICALGKESPEAFDAFIRENEASIALEVLSEIEGISEFNRILELGCGKGIQARILSKHCVELLSSDVKTELITRNRELFKDYLNIKWEVLNSENLSCFEDGVFDVVFSSNMLEHVKDKDRCLEEIKRVVSQSGVIVVAVPSRVWKLSTGLVFYLKEIYNILRKRSFRIHGLNVHGEYRGHIREFIAYGRKKWENLLVNNGFEIAKTVRYPFYHGHRNTYVWLLKLGNILRCTSSYCFFLRKK